MQFHVFYIPTKGNAELQEKLNLFLRSHSIINVHKELVHDGADSFWAYSVEEMMSGKVEKKGAAKKERIDYRELLSEKDFALFSVLREKRNKLAKAEAVSLWNVAYNSHLAAMAENRPQTKTDLLTIDKFGEQSVEKYGEEFLKIIADETSRKSD